MKSKDELNQQLKQRILACRGVRATEGGNSQEAFFVGVLRHQPEIAGGKAMAEDCPNTKLVSLPKSLLHNREMRPASVRWQVDGLSKEGAWITS
jgi:hypothetical protein